MELRTTRHADLNIRPVKCPVLSRLIVLHVEYRHHLIQLTGLSSLDVETSRAVTEGHHALNTLARAVRTLNELSHR